MSERINYEREPLPPEIDYYVLLDFDRCIGNTDRLQGILEEVVTHHSFISQDDMQLARERDEKLAKSFDTASWVQARLLEAGQHEGWQDIATDFVAEALAESRKPDSDVLMPGAYQLIKYLDDKQIPYGFLTFGSHDWQVTKLRAAGQAYALQMIVDNKQKGRLLASWYQAGKGYMLPAELSPSDQPTLVKHLVFLDDKPVSFEGAPTENITLIHVVDPSGRTVPSQAGIIPEAVSVASGLTQAQAIIESQEPSNLP